jgi:hypothetical protein
MGTSGFDKGNAMAQRLFLASAKPRITANYVFPGGDAEDDFNPPAPFSLE